MEPCRYEIFSGADGYHDYHHHGCWLIRVVPVQNISSWQMVGPCSGSIREYLMMCRGPGFSPSSDLAPNQTPTPFPVSKLSLFLSFPVCHRSSLLAGGGGNGGGAKSLDLCLCCSDKQLSWNTFPRIFSLCELEDFLTYAYWRHFWL